MVQRATLARAVMVVLAAAGAVVVMGLIFIKAVLYFGQLLTAIPVLAAAALAQEQMRNLAGRFLHHLTLYLRAGPPVLAVVVAVQACVTTEVPEVRPLGSHLGSP